MKGLHAMNQTTSSDQNLTIAVVGSGISGITAAFLLSRQYDVTLFEKNNYVGGHTHTVVIEDGPDKGTPVDTGFIVLNERTYPNFIRFLSLLGVEKEATDMSFSYYCLETGLAYASRNLNAIFAQRVNLLSPSYWMFLYGMLRFLRRTRDAYYADEIGDVTLEAFLSREGFSDDVKNRFVIPMAAAIWSAPDTKMAEFPMQTFARFYENHGLLSATNHPPWYFVKGGSHSYVHAFLKTFPKDRVHVDEGIAGIKRMTDHVRIRLKSGEERLFSKVVIAAHADEALALLEDPTGEEKRLLSPWAYSTNTTVLHTDASLMPPEKRAWASWNYVREKRDDDSSPITVTYHMNRLQRISSRDDYFVTLNPNQTIPSRHQIREITYTHPVYTFDSTATHAELDTLNGQHNTYFCGAYFGYGFHEDGVKSGISVAEKFGISL
jgi:uncharacterized protein